MARWSSTARSRPMPAAPSGWPSGPRSEIGTTGGAESSPSGSRRARTAAGSVSPRLTTTCGCAAAACAATSSSDGTRSTDVLPAAVNSRAERLGCVAVPADNKDTGAGESVVIHT